MAAFNFGNEENSYGGNSVTGGADLYCEVRYACG